MNEQELSLEAIKPGIAELTQLADQYRGLTIKDVDDVAGYKAVHDARMALRAERVRIVKACKAMREKAVDFQKKVIAQEKEYIGIIEPVELALHAQEETVDLEKARIKRAELMPAREEKLKAVDAAYSYDLVLDMDDDAFDCFYNQAHAAHLARKEAEMKAEAERREAEAKAAREKEEAEARARREAEEAEAKAKREAEEATLRAEREKLEAEKRAAAEEAAKKEAALKADRDRLEAEKAAEDRRKAEEARAAEVERQKKEAADRAVKEAEELRAKEEAERKAAEEAKRREEERTAKFQDFLKAHGYHEAEAMFHVERLEADGKTVVVLYKKVGEITL